MPSAESAIRASFRRSTRLWLGDARLIVDVQSKPENCAKLDDSWLNAILSKTDLWY